MLIKEVKIHLLEMEGKRPIRTMFVIPGQLWKKWTNGGGKHAVLFR